MRTLNNSLFFASGLLCTLAVIVGFRRKMLSGCPMFFGYMAFSGLQTLLYLAMWSLPDVNLYGWLLVAATVGAFLIEIATIYELWNILVLSRSSVGSIFRPLPRWTVAVLLLMATVVAALLPQSVSTESFRVYSTLNVCLSFIDLGLLVALLLVTRLTAISWGILPAGVALGIAISDIGSASSAALINHLGMHYYSDTVLEGLSILSAAVWLTSVLMSNPSGSARELRADVSSKHAGTLELLNRMIRG